MDQNYDYIIDNDIVIDTKKGFNISTKKFLKRLENDAYYKETKDISISKDKKTIKYTVVDISKKKYNVEVKKINDKDEEYLNDLLTYMQAKPEERKGLINPRKIFKRKYKDVREDTIDDIRYGYISGTIILILRLLAGSIALGGIMMTILTLITGSFIPKILLMFLASPSLELGLAIGREFVALYRTWVETKKEVKRLTGEKSLSLFKALGRKNKRRKVKKIVEKKSISKEISNEKADRHLEVLEKVNKINKKLDMLETSSRNKFREELLTRLNQYSTMITNHTSTDNSLKLYDETVETLNFIVFLDNLSVRIDAQLEKEKYNSQIKSVTEEVFDDYTDDLTETGTISKSR